MNYETLTEAEWKQVDRVYDLLDDGKVDQARREADALAKGRPDHPDLKILDATVAIDEGDYDRALRVLAGAERSADPSTFFHLRAVASYELARFQEAREDAERAISVRPEVPEAHDLLSRIVDHLGDHERAMAHAEEAEALDPETFPMPLDVSDAEFDTLVEQSIAELPARVRQHLDELPVLVEPLPSLAMIAAERPILSPDILGLFVGRHLMERSHADLPSVPGAIYLFRRNLLRTCKDRDALKREVRITVQHEVGHMLGLDEDELEAWGLA